MAFGASIVYAFFAMLTVSVTFDDDYYYRIPFCIFATFYLQLKGSGQYRNELKYLWICQVLVSQT